MASLGDTYPGFGHLFYVNQTIEYTVYEEERWNRDVPQECCLWKDYTQGTNIEQNEYRMRYVVKQCGKNHSQILEKVAICQPDVYECNGSLISVMTALLSDNVEPRYYEIKNELVTERVIYLKQVCVYRDFLWNTKNRSAFMAKDDYHLTDRRRRKTYSGPNTLRHELMAVMKNYQEGMMIPTKEERPSGPRNLVKPLPHTGYGWRPFWPIIKEDLIDTLKQKGYFYFFPTTLTNIETFRDNTDISREIKSELMSLLCDSCGKCNTCDQDYCVWSMNKATIIRNVILMKGGIWESLYTNLERREIGCKLAIYIMNNGSGRRYDRIELPGCVLKQLKEKWP